MSMVGISHRQKNMIMTGPYKTAVKILALLGAIGLSIMVGLQAYDMGYKVGHEKGYKAGVKWASSLATNKINSLWQVIHELQMTPSYIPAEQDKGGAK